MKRIPLTPTQRKQAERKRMKEFLQPFGFNSLEALGTSLKNGDIYGKQFICSMLRRWDKKEIAALYEAGQKVSAT